MATIGKTYPCPYENCSSTFNRPYRLTQHIFAHNNQKNFRCQEAGCNKAYTNNSHLFRHINTCHRVKEIEYRFICPKCLKSFANRQNLKRHLERSHDSTKLHACDVCNEEFKKKHLLSTHMYRHTGIKPFSCELCPKMFITMIERRKHMRAHKTYKCIECDAVFYQWSIFMRHKSELHTSHEFTCDYCQKQFKMRMHIIDHIRNKHIAGPQTYVCHFLHCTRAYTTRSNLKEHIKVKHMSMTYDCYICYAQLSAKQSLLQHLKLHERPPMVKVEKEKKPRKPRKDKGTFKTSTACKLAGISLNMVDATELNLKSEQ